jgi:peptidylprolyl isomerase
LSEGENVSRRSRRALPLLLSVLLTLGATSCGEDDNAGSESDALDKVTIEGEAGSKPEVTIEGNTETDEITTEVISEGDGEEVASGDQVLTHIWLGNFYNQEKAFSTWDEGQPQQITVSEDQASPVFLEALEGQTIGSRVAVTTPAEEVFGPQGNPQFDIGNKDTVLLVLDLMEMYQPPEPKDVPQAQMPEVVEQGGEPVRLDFSGIPEPRPDGEFMRTVLEEGDGEEISTDSTIEADYLGMVHGAKKPFDESYSGKPAEFSLTGVVEGWTYGLSGLKVGSRVLLAIPPDLGYGAQEQAGIPANSTLYFVVDIVSAK